MSITTDFADALAHGLALAAKDSGVFDLDGAAPVWIGIDLGIDEAEPA